MLYVCSGCAPCKGGAFQWVQIPSGNRLQPEAIGAVMEGTKGLKPSISVSQIGDSASVQAATRVNAEQSSKRVPRPTNSTTTLQRSLRQACACGKPNPDIWVLSAAENWAAKNVPGEFGAREI